MRVHEFDIPKALCELIEAEVWPNAREACSRQELDPILGEEAAHVLSLEDDRIILMQPPFHTISDEVASGHEFWNRDLSNVGEIEYKNAVIIADFGLGSDSPIILYYDGAKQPSVMYLKWLGNGSDIRHSWVRTHHSFEEFASAVGLASPGL